MFQHVAACYTTFVKINVWFIFNFELVSEMCFLQIPIFPIIKAIELP